MDPDKLANGLMWFGCPEQLSFSISYAYRMLPILMEEFQNVLLSYRLRGNPPAHDTLWGKIRYLAYQIQHGQAVPHHRRGTGDQGLPLRRRQPRSQKAQAGLPQGNE